MSRDYTRRPKLRVPEGRTYEEVFFEFVKGRFLIWGSKGPFERIDIVPKAPYPDLQFLDTKSSIWGTYEGFENSSQWSLASRIDVDAQGYPASNMSNKARSMFKDDPVIPIPEPTMVDVLKASYKSTEDKQNEILLAQRARKQKLADRTFETSSDVIAQDYGRTKPAGLEAWLPNTYQNIDEYSEYKYGIRREKTLS